MYKRLLIVAALVTTVCGIAGTASVSAKHTENTDPNKITICHRTNATNNPYVVETISKNAANGNRHDDHTSHTGNIASSFAVATAMKADHEKWGDIIPAYDNFPGQNWSTEGQLVYNNHCHYPVTEEETAMIDYAVVCDVANSRAVITLTNTGTADGSATVNGTAVIVAAQDDAITHISTPSGKTKVTIVIDNVTVYDEELDCRAGGQGGVKDPDVNTPVATPTTPNGQAGQGAANEPAIASLPYTAGKSKQPFALILSAIVTAAIIAGTVIKKAYLKHV